MPGNTGIEALDKATGQAMEGWVERETQAGWRHGGGLVLTCFLAGSARFSMKHWLNS